MTKDEIIMDWLDSKENRSQLSTISLENDSYDLFRAYGDIYHTKDGAVICGMGNHLYILSLQETTGDRP